MKRNKRSQKVLRIYIVVLWIFYFVIISGVLPTWAQQVSQIDNTEQDYVIAFIHPIASQARILINDLAVWDTDMVFGVWVYQVNLTPWLDTKPSKVEIQVWLGNEKQAYCKAELISGKGSLDKAKILQKISFNAADAEGNKWNRYNTIIKHELSRPKGSIRPIWTAPHEHQLGHVIRSNSVDLVREVQNSLQTGSISDLMPLITPALTNQAVMEGASPELLIHSMENFLKKNCIPNIKMAETRRDYYKSNYKNAMAPIDYKDLTYRFAKTDSGERGNLYTPSQTIEFSTKDNRKFKASVFLSYTDENRNKRFISRFFFDRTE